jgi:acyl carrier protein
MSDIEARVKKIIAEQLGVEVPGPSRTARRSTFRACVPSGWSRS